MNLSLLVDTIYHLVKDRFEERLVERLGSLGVHECLVLRLGSLDVHECLVLRLGSLDVHECLVARLDNLGLIVPLKDVISTSVLNTRS